jgi:hypothetical protein
MILSNAASAGAFGERLLVLRLEQRRVAGREPPSEPRSAGRPGYSGESLVHLHRHRAPISATQPTDLRLTDIRAMATQATRDSPLTPTPRPMDTRADRHTLPIPVPVMDIPWLAIPATALRESGLLGPSTLSNLLAAFRPKTHP